MKEVELLKIQWRLILGFTFIVFLISATTVIGDESIFHIDIPDKEKAGNSNFKPGELKVKVGDKIVWTNNDSRTHFISSMSTCDYPGSSCNKALEDDEDELEEEAEEEESGSNLASDTFYFTSDYLDQGKTFTYIFEKVGVYKYYCFTHPLEMTGFVEVKE